MKKVLLSACIFLTLFYTATAARKPQLFFCGRADNDLYLLLQKNGFNVKQYNNPADAIQAAAPGDAVFIVADGYPATLTATDTSILLTAKNKRIKVYTEYTATLPGIQVSKQPVNTQLERGVVLSRVFGSTLPPMSILGINDCHILPAEVKDPLIVLAKVAGFDKAAYGVADVRQYPLLFEQDNLLAGMTKLSSFATGRYGPQESWKVVWAYILERMTGRKDIHFSYWPSYVSPMYKEHEALPANAKQICVEKGITWFWHGHFFINPSWKELWRKYQGDGTNPVGPPLGQELPDGDGTSGLLEGHASRIAYDGKQQYRYWLRADVQGEAAFALAAAASLLDNKRYNDYARNLINFIFKGSNLAPAKDDTASAVHGLIGWSVTHPNEFYGDDNARAILGILGASAYMNTSEWNELAKEAIMANFNTTGIYGFRGNRLKEQDLLKQGKAWFAARDVVNPAPHFESWMWALYLWLYDKTGYEPLLNKTRTAIRMTMEAYPAKWKWTNGIQQERARMILPLAWLVRVENTPQHRQWLDTMVQQLLQHQAACGAIREELGPGQGKYGRTPSNKEYGLREAPLIFDNGDPVADMLYTSNFAYFSLNEAAHATGNIQYKKAVDKLGDFLIRIQVKSSRFKDLDGAWFRAFDYNRWDYWGSNADAGWGAWGTLTGWTQSWIVATQVLTSQNKSYWEETQTISIIPKKMTAKV